MITFFFTKTCLVIIFLFFAVNCQPGFQGEYCETRCIYPEYGYGCLQRCTCPKGLCHFSTGCTPREHGKCLIASRMIFFSY